MKNITKDEMYNWMPCPNASTADARIPNELHKSLTDAISIYNNVCKMIYEYLETHPEDEFKI